MTKNLEAERRTGARFVVSLPIKVEWKDETGNSVLEEGLTENVGADGTLIHLPKRLPSVGTRVQLAVYEVEGKGQIAAAEAEVLRLERNPAHQQAALRLVDALDDWRVKVFESEDVRIAAVGTPEEFDD
ncbi:MAG: hypothetical protein M3209_08825 [Acidobacteriota bacterium]|nr:hypothetical protein [Acidobacteriota bacterium]